MLTATRRAPSGWNLPGWEAGTRAVAGAAPGGCPTGAGSCRAPLPWPSAHAAPCPPPSPLPLPARCCANASPGPHSRAHPGSFSKASSLALPAVAAWAGIWQGTRGAPRAHSPSLRFVSVPHGRSGIRGGPCQVWSYRMPSSQGAAVPSPTRDSGSCLVSPSDVALMGLTSACYHPPQPQGS